MPDTRHAAASASTTSRGSTLASPGTSRARRSAGASAGSRRRASLGRSRSTPRPSSRRKASSRSSEAASSPSRASTSVPLWRRPTSIPVASRSAIANAGRRWGAGSESWSGLRRASPPSPWAPGASTPGATCDAPLPIAPASSTATRAPRCAARQATERPIRPPPTTRMSSFPFAGMTRSRFDGRRQRCRPLSPTGSRVSHHIVVSLPPGPSAPRQWQTLQYGLRPYAFFAGAQRRYGDVFTVRVMQETWVVVADPDGVRAVLTNDPADFRSGEANLPLRSVIGTRNVLLLDGAEHLARRRLVLPPFHGERLQSSRAVMADVTREHLATWPRGEPFPLLPRMSAITLEIIVRVVFGARADEAAALRAALKRLLDWLVGPRGLVAFNVLGPGGIQRVPAFRRMVAAVDEAVGRQIERRREEPGDDVLSMLLQTEGLTDRDVRDEVLTLLVAGHETTAAALAWSFEALLREPDALARVAAREPGWADAVARESLRLRPPVPLVLRKLLAPNEIGGHPLPAGTTCAPSSILLHRDAQLYPDPNAFRPERWLGDRKPGTYEWIPFGANVRRCI